MDVLGMRSGQVNIPWVPWKSSVEAAMSSTKAIQRAMSPILQVEIPTMTTSSPDPSVGEEGLQAAWIRP
jgi:hypothetical protein